MGVFRMSTKVIFDTNGDYTVESEDMIRKESGSSINEENKKQEGKEPLRQKQPKQPVQVEEKTNTTFENVIFLTISEFLKNENIEKDLFTNQILSKLHVFICTPATAHHIGNNLVIYGAIQLDTNEVVLHCISLKSNIHTIFVFYIDKSEVADVKFNIAPSGILKVDETMVCSLRAKPNGI